MRSVALVLLALVSTEAVSQDQGCALTPGRTGNFETLSNPAGVVAFTSGLAVNADGAPNAYHRVLGPDKRDSGATRACGGGWPPGVHRLPGLEQRSRHHRRVGFAGP